MDITPLISSDQQVIQSYSLKNSDADFRISGQYYYGPVFVRPNKTIKWPASTDINDLKPEHFDDIADELAGLDVLLLGTGAEMHFLPPDLQQDLRARNIKPEAMDTGAACRTFNVLLAEGRVMGALLLPYQNQS